MRFCVGQNIQVRLPAAGAQVAESIRVIAVPC
jgi:hypothetical protein